MESIQFSGHSSVFHNIILSSRLPCPPCLNSSASMLSGVSGHLPPDTSPGLFPSDEKLYISRTKCHKSNFYLQTELFPSIPLPFQQRTFFIKCKGRLYRFWANFVNF